MTAAELPELNLDAVREHMHMIAHLAADHGGKLVVSAFHENPDTGEKLDPEVRHVVNDPASVNVAERLTRAVDGLARDEHRNVYIHAATLRDDLGPGKRGGKSDVKKTLALVCDFDDANAAKYPNRLPLKPDTVLESSPGRYHCWYIFDKPLSPKRARAIAERLVTYSECDKCSKDLDHVWRIAGTLNWPNAKKIHDGRNRVPALVRVVEPWAGSLTGADEIERALEAAAPSVVTEGTNDKSTPAEWTTGPVTGAAPIEDNGALIEKARASKGANAAFGKSAPFEVLWTGDESALSKHYKSDSEKDSALAWHLIWWTGGDCERTERLMRQSGLARPKWDEHRTYLRDTIRKALARTSTFYTGGGGHDDNEVPGWVAKVNEEYAVVLEQGEALIYQFEDGIPTNAMSFHSFRHWFANKRTPANNSGNTRKIGDAWLDHPKRKEYKKVIFKPNATPAEGVLNLWDDFAIKPAPGDWSLIDAHIRDVVCGGSQALHSYVLGWLARMVQYPDLVGEVALVMRGGQGTGKGVLGRCVGRIMGRHTLLAGSPEHLVGKFDGQLRNKCFVFCDEAHFPGDPRQKRKLRNLITEPEITIEPKFKTPIPVYNFMHMMMAGNDDWLVPADIDDRRFCVLDVSAHQRGHASYFDALCNQMGIDREKRTDGLAAMLHDLLEIDISDFNVRKVPQTAGLIDQKLHGLTGPKRWLANCLQQGRIAGREWGDEPLEIEKSVVFSDYEMWSGSRKSGEFKTEMWGTWSREIRNMLPGAIHDRRIGKDGSRVRCWCFDPLPQARDAFDSVLGGPTRWDDGCGADSENEEKGCDIFS